MKYKRILYPVLTLWMFICCFCMSVDASSKLSAPVVSTSNVASSGKIKLTWKKVSGAKKYKVYRATSKSGTYTLMKTTTSTSYTNTSAEAGKTYYYKVKAIGSSDSITSAYSTAKYRTCDLARPSITLSTDSSTGKTVVSWEAVKGATKYKVYRSESKNGEYKRMLTTSKTSYTNTSAKAGETFYYKVKAITSNSAADSAYSTAKYRTCKLAKPEVSVALNSDGKPKLTWEAISGAVGYEVYRATSESGDYILMKETTNTSFTNSGAYSGTTYYYKVRAIHSKSEAKSAYSDIVSITPTMAEEILVKNYVSGTEATLYSQPDSSSDAIKLCYMTEVDMGVAVSSGDSGKWYRVFYQDKLYYTWIPAGVTRFTTEQF